MLQTGLFNALKLLGNTHAHFNVERRQNVLKSINPDLLHLASEDLFDEVVLNLFGPGLPKFRRKGLMLCQPCDRPDPSQTKPFQKGGAPPYKSQGRPTFGNSRFQPYPQSRGYHQGYQGYPKPPTNRPPPSGCKSGIVGSFRPGNGSHGSQRPSNHPTSLALGSQRPGTNPIHQNPHTCTCRFKPDRSGHVPNPDRSSLGKLSEQHSHGKSCDTSSSSPTAEPGHLIRDNRMEWTSGGLTVQVHRELENDHGRPGC